MIAIIDRYLIREIFTTFVTVFSVLFIIVITNRLVIYLAKAASGAISNDVIFALLILQSIYISSLLLPVSFFCSTLLALGRLYRDSEITVLNACGIGPKRLFYAVLVLALPFTLLTTVLTLHVVPWIVYKVNIINLQDQENMEIHGLVAGRFNEIKKGDAIFFIEQLSKDKKTMSKVFIQNRQHGKQGLILAEHGERHIDSKTGHVYLRLSDGIRFEGTPGQADVRLVEFDKYSIHIKENIATKAPLRRDMMSVAQLRISDDLTEQAELQWRYAIPASLIMLGMLAVPLSKTSPREGKYSKLMVAILIYVIYANLMAAAKNLMGTDVTPAWLGLWWVHIPIIVITILLSRHSQQKKMTVGIFYQPLGFNRVQYKKVTQVLGIRY